MFALVVVGGAALLLTLWPDAVVAVARVFAWAWTLAPLPMSLLYAAALCGLAAALVYPRWRPGVEWREVARNTRRAVPPGSVTEYLTRLRGDRDRAV